MGQEIKTSHFSAQDFDHFQQRLDEETRLLAQWFSDSQFAQHDLVAGYELEAWLIDSDGQPSPSNKKFLDAANSPLLTPELAQFNVELNTDPETLRHTVLSDFEKSFNSHWRYCQQIAEQLDCYLLSTGILPTLETRHLTLANISELKRYRALNEQVLDQRKGKPFQLKITGHESLTSTHQDVMLESAATSLQIHLQVPQDMAVRYYNAAILLSAPMVAISANSPFLFGKDLWAETRIPVFEQSVNVGGFSGAAHGPIHRVSFGTAYARESLMECFEENLDHFPILLPMQFEEPATAMKHLSLHNGTIWRWNRPLIGFDDKGKPHLRIEHRVMPSGPSIVDNIANMALFYGLVYYYANLDTPVESIIEFPQARDNFYTAAQHGLNDHITWPDCNRCTIRHLVLNQLLEQAETGLKQLNIDNKDIEFYLGIIQARAEHNQTGSDWQRRFVEQHGRDMQCLTQSYYHNQQTGEPVHCWDLLNYS
ncbi:MAG: glutamate-cysteine ligase family protein [Gammaproteobacteria bacterium]|nr:glutamate-cysteine ligase family protein [Gammaproteobacteria bacterium]